ncbi:hypothetical protein HK101_006605, partial [Irineochytrium annulatum]
MVNVASGPPAALGLPGRTASTTMRYAKALYDFMAKEADELQMEEEDIISIPTKESKNGWLHGENNGAWGWFPEDYVRILSEEEAISEGLISYPTSSAPATATAPSPLSQTMNDDDADDADEPTTSSRGAASHQDQKGGWFSKYRQKNKKATPGSAASAPASGVATPRSEIVADDAKGSVMARMESMGSVSEAGSTADEAANAQLPPQIVLNASRS